MVSRVEALSSLLVLHLVFLSQSLFVSLGMRHKLFLVMTQALGVYFTVILDTTLLPCDIETSFSYHIQKKKVHNGKEKKLLDEQHDYSNPPPYSAQ